MTHAATRQASIQMAMALLFLVTLYSARSAPIQIRASQIGYATNGLSLVMYPSQPKPQLNILWFSRGRNADSEVALDDRYTQIDHWLPAAIPNPAMHPN
jgi:hypothetical protein